MRIYTPLLLAACLSTQAHADECATLPPPSVKVQRLEENLAVNLTYSYKSLNNIASSLLRPGRQILGLTRGMAVARYATKIHSLRDPNGRWECASPEITISYGFSPITIYVAREFPDNTCAYREIHTHELRHVDAYRAHAQAIESEIRQTLEQRFASGTPWRGPIGQTQARLQQEMNERWLPYLKRMLEQVESRQALIDTTEEYERVAASCNGEIAKRLK